MYYRAIIKDGDLLSVVCDTMDVCGFIASNRESDAVLTICDAESAHKYVGVCPCVVLWRDENFAKSTEYKRLSESGSFASLRVPFSIEQMARLVREHGTGRTLSYDAAEEVKKPQLTRDGALISYGDLSVILTERELRLFEYLYAREGKVVSRADILRDVWQSDTESNIVDVYVSYLRRKLDTILQKGSLTAVRGSGYILRI